MQVEIVQEIEIRQITAIDLLEEATSANSDAGQAIAYQLRYDGGQRGDMLWFADIRRAGIALGGNAIWTDASSPEDAIERVLSDNVTG